MGAGAGPKFTTTINRELISDSLFESSHMPGTYHVCEQTLITHHKGLDFVELHLLARVADDTFGRLHTKQPEQGRMHKEIEHRRAD